MFALIPLGRYLLALPMAVFGIFHLMNASMMAGMVPSYLPGGVVWVYLTGLCLLAACVSILIGKKAKTASTLLAIMLILFVLMIHLPSLMAGHQDSMGMILKDLAIAGGALVYAGTAKD
ncbi:MAG: DoxX family protein [Spirosomataceae bacterium]